MREETVAICISPLHYTKSKEISALSQNWARPQGQLTQRTLLRFALAGAAVVLVKLWI